MSNLADLLSGQGKDWVADRLPLSEIEIEAAKRRIGRQLPPTLLELYALCDGGAGSLPRDPYYFGLWGIKEVAETREHEHYRRYYDRYVLFGSSGGGVYFGIDEAGRVFFMDPIAGEDSIEVYSATFDEFIAEVGLALSDEEMDRESAETTADYAFHNLDDEKIIWVLHGGPAPAKGTFRAVLELAHRFAVSGRTSLSIASAGNDRVVIGYEQMTRLWDQLGLPRPSTD